MRYEVVEYSDLKPLEIEVEKRLNDGWTLQGGISVTEDESQDCMFYQAMTTNNMSYTPATKR